MKYEVRSKKEEEKVKKEMKKKTGGEDEVIVSLSLYLFVFSSRCNLRTL